MMKGQKGITLVALIITIIVMLILVGVSISVALNGGLFDRANSAVSETKAAQVNEAVALARADIISGYYLGEYDDAAPSADTVEDLINDYLEDDMAVTVTGSDWNYTISALPAGVELEDTSITFDLEDSDDNNDNDDDDTGV